MRRRFLADEVHGDTAALMGQNARRLAQVLRAKAGQEYEIAAEGKVRLGTVRSVSDERVEFSLGQEIASRELVPITLVIAIFKFDRLEWAIEKATELGVARIMPIVARRTESHLGQSAEKRVERWRRIAHEASQQSRRVSPPEISDPVKLKEAVAIEAELKVLCAETEDNVTVRDVLSRQGAQTRLSAPTHSVALAVGPEGGWTDDELKLFADNGWQSASLGKTILRAETAAIAASVLASSFLTPDY